MSKILLPNCPLKVPFPLAGIINSIPLLSYLDEIFKWGMKILASNGLLFSLNLEMVMYVENPQRTTLLQNINAASKIDSKIISMCLPE